MDRGHHPELLAAIRNYFFAKLPSGIFERGHMKEPLCKRICYVAKSLDLGVEIVPGLIILTYPDGSHRLFNSRNQKTGKLYGPKETNCIGAFFTAENKRESKMKARRQKELDEIEEQLIRLAQTA